ncbi:YegS/Rv2252/BmrU family lipid kinase [Halohasta litchfieldiae]|jgi:YegS/Rv2252/BmrU family lipid kinase|uniref:Lipid kinase, YegS/Rv2252/BmrU family n=1 Tax=Halohasta litchfieldiae TaxID=1073996 RepID=A0A1H6RA86_9EURY|nr:diacylglycerol kinase family protein [Halohasta litchfieldiae]ATW88598.1 YegS/Rv2252/BmrU family lipid kinase [Halohasta litchfieldiae]SEI48112.1 lipid kinase, YegS/Rv2252/BmrU family [Halohasta litchfieldiae]
MGEPRSGRPADRRLIVNPVSGEADHVETVHRLAALHQFPVVETERSGHAVDLAKQAAAEGVDMLAVCGGDGTVHEVIQGLFAVDALDTVTLCVVPAGTENIIAEDLGIDGLGEGFEVATGGERRRLDLGVANDEPFVMSAVAGLPAEVSDATTGGLKQRFGSAAFLIGGLKAGQTFDGLDVTVDARGGGDEVVWTDEALAVVVGNLRRFGTAGGHANAEDGLLDVEIIEQMPGTALRDAIEGRLLGRECSHIRTFETTRLGIDSLVSEPIRFSLDGEIRTFETVQFGIVPQALTVRVGSAYTPVP